MSLSPISNNNETICHSHHSLPLSYVVQSVQVRCFTPSTPGLPHRMSALTSPQANTLSPSLPVFSLTPYGKALSPQSRALDGWSPQNAPLQGDACWLKETMPFGFDEDLMDSSQHLKGSMAIGHLSSFAFPSTATPMMAPGDDPSAISPIHRVKLDAHETHFLSSLTSIPPKTQGPAVVPQPSCPAVTLREATPADAEGIIALRDSLDMTGAVSLLWDLEEMCTRIADRHPLLLIAVTTDLRENSLTHGDELVIGVAGMDVHGMEKELHLKAIGSRLIGAPANSDYSFPSDYCMCRGLLIHQDYQGAGLGSKLHKGRLKLLAHIAPNTKGVILGARGSTLEEALAVIAPHLDGHQSDVTPEFTKDELFEFTFHTSKGIVHMVHGKDREGWKFVGVDVADGGAIWVTSLPLPELVTRYDTVVHGIPALVANDELEVKGPSLFVARRGTTVFGG